MQTEDDLNASENSAKGEILLMTEKNNPKYPAMINNPWVQL